MPSFGRYEIVDELYRTPFGCVYSARMAGENANGRRNDYVVKIYEPPDFQGGEAFPTDASAPNEFLEGAALQKLLCEKQALHWAPIHDLGTSEGKAYYVTDYYPRTAQRLIAGRVVLASPALYEIIGSVAQGLCELREVCNQPHGSLKPSNILIGGSGEVSGAKIVLTDPVCHIPPADADQGGDFYALGALLYQLIMHRPFRATSWPVEDSPEWSRLGKTADRWRMLCTLLLNPDAHERPTAEVFEQSLRDLAPGGFSMKRVAALPRAAVRKVPMRKVAVATSFLALSVGGTGTFFALKLSASRTRVEQARIQWLDAMWKDKPTLARFQQAFGEPVIQDSDWEAVQTPQSGITLAALSLSAFRQSAAADAAIAGIRNRLHKDYDKAAEPLRPFQQTFQRKGYQQAAEYLKGILDATPADDASLIPAIIARIALQNQLQSNPLPVVSEETVAALKRLESSNDDDQKAFAKAITEAFPSTWKLTSGGWQPVNGTDLNGLVKGLNLSNWPADYDEAQLNKDIHLDLTQMRLADVQLWLSKVGDYQKVTIRPDQLRTTELDLRPSLLTTREDVRKKLAQFPVENAALLKELGERYAKIDGQITALSQQKFRKKDRDNEFAAAVGTIKKNIQLLHDRFRSNAPADLSSWFAHLAEQGNEFKSPVVQAFWNKSVKGMDIGHVDAVWRKQTDALLGTLQHMDSEFAVPSELDNVQWGGPVHEKAAAELAGILSAIAQPTMQPPEDVVKTATDDFKTWCDCVTDLRKEHDRLEKSLIDATAVADYDSRWSAEPRLSFWKNEVLLGGHYSALMNKIRRRINAVRAATRTPAEALATLHAQKTSDEVVLAAWGAIGTPKLNGFVAAGPPTAASIQDAANIFGTVNAAAAKLSAPSAKVDLQKEVAQCARQLWQRSVAAANSADVLDAAFTLEDASQIALPEHDMKPDAVWFNVWLYRAKHPRSAADIALDQARYLRLSPADQYALQSEAGSEDVAKAAIERDLYLWPKDEPKREQVWREVEARQLHAAGLALEDCKPEQAQLALVGIPGEPAAAKRQEIKLLIKSTDQNQKAGVGEFLKGNFGAAKRNLEAAAQGGNAAAMVNLGGMYRGKGHPPIFPPNLEQSLLWFERAAAAGNSQALAELAGTYLTTADWEKADDLLVQASKARPPVADTALAPLMRELAQKYEQTGNSKKNDWYRAAAGRGDATSDAWLHSRLPQPSKPPTPGGGGGSSLLDGKTGK